MGHRHYLAFYLGILGTTIYIEKTNKEKLMLKLDITFYCVENILKGRHGNGRPLRMLIQGSCQCQMTRGSRRGSKDVHIVKSQNVLTEVVG